MNTNAWLALIGAVVAGLALWGLGNGLTPGASLALSDGLKLLLGIAFVGWIGWLYLNRRRG